ncbi:DUF6124 family protein [Pseudomonas sp. NPDC089534]|uniref:DUF6124 family protein n=1 Tax=Pseudomonas sp. NPDC089534 TaxID=3364468 RepID=UPI0038092D52
MDKLIPDPPSTTPLADARRAEDQARNEQAVKRALDFYLNPEPHKRRQPSAMYTVCPNIGNENLLADACESLASASILVSHFANELSGPHRSMALGIQQIVMLAELAVNRALDRVVPLA